MAAMPGTLRPMPSASRGGLRFTGAGLSWGAALGGAAALMALLIGGQLLFPPTVQTSQIVLPKAVDMNSGVASAGPPSTPISSLAGPEEHVVNRIPADDSVKPSTSDSARTADHSATTTDAKPTDHSKSSDTSKTGSSEALGPAKPTLSRKVSFLKGSLTLDLYQQALIGSPTAPYVVVEIVDYACPHCRAMNKTMQQAIDRYGDQLAIVILPMPLELECNKMMNSTEPAHFGACKLARLALAVSEVDPTAFVDFHEWLMADKDNVPEIGKALAKAYRLADAKKIRERATSAEIEQRIQSNISLYESLAAQRAKDSSAAFGLPVQIVGDQVISGDTVSGDELLAKWQEILGIKPL
jgi:protein-disulfide isomerase